MFTHTGRNKRCNKKERELKWIALDLFSSIRVKALTYWFLYLFRLSVLSTSTLPVAPGNQQSYACSAFDHLSAKRLAYAYSHPPLYPVNKAPNSLCWCSRKQSTPEPPKICPHSLLCSGLRMLTTMHELCKCLSTGPLRSNSYLFDAVHAWQTFPDQIGPKRVGNFLKKEEQQQQKKGCIFTIEFKRNFIMQAYSG